MSISTSRRAGLPGRISSNGVRANAGPSSHRRHGVQDERWSDVKDALARLRAAGRYSVRIVDADCGNGDLLLEALLHARALGFTAIEGRGIDGAPSKISAASRKARNVVDRAIGVTFEVADVTAALAEEAEMPADLILWSDQPGALQINRALAAAGNTVIARGLARAA